MKEEKEIIGGGHELMINRTGIMLTPELAAELVQDATDAIPSSEGVGEDMETERAEYAQEALPIGSYPAAPMNGREEVGSGDESAIADDRMAVLFDKLGERLAFERQGTRLYESFIQKIAAMPMEDSGAPTADDLRQICQEELEHFKLLQNAIVELGGDATVQTPSADVAGVLSHGALQIMSDPRTTVTQALQAALTAELADNDGWAMLQDLAEQLKCTKLADQCAKAFEQEQEHLENVRTWLSNMILNEAAGEPPLIDSDDAVDEDGGDKKTSPRRSSKAKRKKPSGSKKKRKK